MSTPELFPLDQPAPAAVRKRARRAAKAKNVDAGADAGAKRARAKTGAGALVNPDNIALYWIAVGILSLGAVAPLIASIEGLLHVADWYLDGLMVLTLPFAVDGLMIGVFVASLALRRRHANIEAGFLTAFVVLLLIASAIANWLQEYVTADLTTIEGLASPWIKGSMPIITFAAFEAIAMLTSTRRQAENAPLRIAQNEVKRLKREVSRLRRAERADHRTERTIFGRPRRTEEASA